MRAFQRETEKIVPAAQNTGASGQPIHITLHVNGHSNAPDVRRAVGQGTREAIANRPKHLKIRGDYPATRPVLGTGLQAPQTLPSVDLARPLAATKKGVASRCRRIEFARTISSTPRRR